MPRVSKLKLPPLRLATKETIGRRISRLRKERGYTQVELARKMGLIQTLVSAYERDQLRLHSDMAIRFSRTLKVSLDELIMGTKEVARNGKKLPLRLMRRLMKIEALPPAKQKALLQTIDGFLKGAKAD